jgi:hypothetical protein
MESLSRISPTASRFQVRSDDNGTLNYVDINVVVQPSLFNHWLRQPYPTGIADLYELRLHVDSPFSNYIIATGKRSVKMANNAHQRPAKKPKWYTRDGAEASAGQADLT